MISWIQDQEYIWNNRMTDYRDTKKKEALWQVKATDMGYTGKYNQIFDINLFSRYHNAYWLEIWSFDYTTVAGSGKVGPVNQANHASWVAVVTPTDRPKSVRNRCVIELFCGVICVVSFPIWHFCWCMGFCHRTESDIFLYLFIYKIICKRLLEFDHQVVIQSKLFSS